MSRKLIKYKGYILLESLISLAIICFIIGEYLMFNTFLLKKTKESQIRVEMYQVLYEEIHCLEVKETNFSKIVDRNNKKYKLDIYYFDNRLYKVEIRYENDQISISKKN